MDNNLHSIDKLFQTKIELYEENPSPEVLHSLKSFLFNHNTKQVIKKRIYCSKAIIIIFLLLISLKLYDFNLVHKSYGVNSGVTNISIKLVKKDMANSSQMRNTINFEDKRIHRKNVKSFKKIYTNFMVYNCDTTGSTLNNNIDDSSYFNNTVIKISALKIFFDSNKTVEKKNITAPENNLRRYSNLNKNETVIGAQKFKPYFVVSPTTSIELAKYNLENNAAQENDTSGRDYKDEISNREKHDKSFSAGLVLNYQFKKDVGLEAGLLYSSTVIDINPHDIYAVKKSDGTLAYKYNASSGYAYLNKKLGVPLNVGDSVATSSAQHNLKYLSLPVMLKYKIRSKKIYVAPAAGITANILLASSLKTEIKNSLNTEKISITKLNGLKRFYVGYIINTEVGYDLNKKVSVNLQSTCKYALSSINNNNVVKTFPYSFGLGIGVSYCFFIH